MNTLFDKTVINRIKLSNRVVRSATWMGLADEDGQVTQKLIKTMTDLANGGVGLIISGHMNITSEGKASLLQTGIYEDKHIPGLKEMTNAVHEHNGKIIAQLAHGGTFAKDELINETPLAVSIFDGLSEFPRKELNTFEISRLIEAFANASERAKSAGFDGIQLHSAHGYLLSQFLSPYYNRRTDKYGGNIQNRTRIITEIQSAIRKKVGNDYPILIKMNCHDFSEEGLTLKDSIQAAKTLSKVGFDAIELSGGLLSSSKFSPCRTKINATEKEAYFKEEALLFKKEINIPLILVGGIRSFETAEKLINDNTADYISMCRPFIREPNIINNWKNGNLAKSECSSENLCFRPGHSGKGVYCMLKNKQKNKQKNTKNI